MEPLQFSKSVFIQTQNTRNLVLMMDDIKMEIGEGRFAVICGSAGLGKSEAIKWYHANDTRTVYIESMITWVSSELAFLRDLCKEFGIEPRHTKNLCFREIYDHLCENPETIIFVDEIDRMRNIHLEYMRDLTRSTMCPFVLCGEPNLLPFMKRNSRVWTRTFEPLIFKTMRKSDVIIYAKEATGVDIGPEIANTLYHTATKNTPDGNFRLVKRAVQYAVQYANSAQSIITKEIAAAAINSAIKWANK